VGKYIVRKRKRRRQTWRTFLRITSSHGVDLLFTADDDPVSVLYVFMVLVTSEDGLVHFK